MEYPPPHAQGTHSGSDVVGASLLNEFSVVILVFYSSASLSAGVVDPPHHRMNTQNVVPAESLRYRKQLEIVVGALLVSTSIGLVSGVRENDLNFFPV